MREIFTSGTVGRASGDRCLYPKLEQKRRGFPSNIMRCISAICHSLVLLFCSSYLGVSILKYINMAFPTFNEAVNRMSKFLKDNEWPTDIYWIKSTDIKFISIDKAKLLRPIKNDKAKAKQLFKDAVIRNFGVAFDGLAYDGQISYVTICWPKDMRESELLLFCDNDLKISLKVPKPIIIK